MTEQEKQDLLDGWTKLYRGLLQALDGLTDLLRVADKRIRTKYSRHN